MGRARSGLLAVRHLTSTQRRLALRALIALPVAHRLIRRRSFAVAEQWCANTPVLRATNTVGLAPAEIGAAARAAVAAVRPLGISCMPQAAVLRSLLCSAGFEAQIRFGVHRTADGLEAHAWVEVDGEPVNEPSDIAQRFPVLATASELSGAVLV